MVRRFLSHFINFCYAYAYKSEKSALFKRIFYKGLLISKMDIYKCPKTKKIMLLFFTKKNTYFNIENLYDHYGAKRGIHQFFTFFKNFAKLQNAKLQKIAKLQKRQ